MQVGALKSYLESELKSLHHTVGKIQKAEQKLQATVDKAMHEKFNMNESPIKVGYAQ